MATALCQRLYSMLLTVLQQQRNKNWSKNVNCRQRKFAPSSSGRKNGLYVHTNLHPPGTAAANIGFVTSRSVLVSSVQNASNDMYCYKHN